MKQLLLLLCCLEVLFVTYLINTLGPYVSPILLIGLSGGICYLYLRLSANPQPVAPAPTFAWLSPKMISVLQILGFLVLSYLIFAKLKFLWWYTLTYGDPEGRSDIIPQITMLVQRFLSGEMPYQIIHFSDYDLFPTYMPLQWLPYMLTEWVGKDYRWVPTFAMWFACLYYFLNNRKVRYTSIWEVIVPLWPMMVWLLVILHHNRMFVYTVEGLIAGYYLFVSESVAKKSIWPLAIGIAVCLMSRYSIVLWVPLCVFLLFISGNKKSALIVCLTAVAFFVFLYWLPFLSRDANIYMSGYNYHTKAAYYEWVRDMDVYGGDVYLFNGLGFSSFAMKLIPGDIAHKIQVYKIVHLSMCLLTVAALAWYYVRNKTKYELRTFMLFSLKVYLVVFYAFIQIPYKYLYFIPILVTASLLGGAFRNGIVNERQTNS